MKTIKTKIDFDQGTLPVEFDGEIVKFNIFDVMKTLTQSPLTLCHIDVVDYLEQEVV